jgi:hypothetical protein
MLSPGFQVGRESRFTSTKWQFTAHWQPSSVARIPSSYANTCSLAPVYSCSLSRHTAGPIAYQPVAMVEEILVQKIVVETARYGRILGLEQQELVRANAFFNTAVDRTGRYTTSTSRGLLRTIEELERIQAARKARETPAVSAATGEVSTRGDVARDGYGSVGAEIGICAPALPGKK